MDKIITDIKELRTVSEPTSMTEVKELNLKKRLRKMVKTAWIKGAGLAAIQIGVPLRFALLILDGKEEILINPRIVIGKGKRIFKNEGCLSIPYSYVDTERFYYIEYLSGNNKIKKAINFKAILIQHEIDHMDGILNIDRKAK